MPHDVVGIVLCGGASRRMGRSKADLPFGPETLLERATRQLLRSVEHVVVAAAPGQSLPDFDHRRVHIVRDPSPHLGPLHGFSTALADLRGPMEYAYLAAVDSPRFAPGWLRLLHDRIGEADAAAAIVAGRAQPFAALYRIDPTRAAIAQLRAEGTRRLAALLERLAVRWMSAEDVATADARGDLFADLDRPEDYRRALARMERDGETSPGFEME